MIEIAREVDLLTYTPKPHNFLYRLQTGKLHIEVCRERFQNASVEDTFVEFFICHNKGSSGNLINFMRTVEQIVDINQSDALTLEPTDSPIVTYVKMTPWWRQRVRRSLLTILLRCGQYFLEDSAKGLQAALYSTPYTSDTRLAVERFLSGHCHVKMRKDDDFQGWWHLFKESGGNPAKILVRVKRKGDRHEVQQQEVVGSP